MADDDRNHPRAGLHLTVEYPDLEAFLHDFRENISQGGTFVSSPREWDVGEPLRLHLTFPGLLHPIRLKGTVAWIRIGQEPGVGIEFHFDKNPAVKRNLEKTVAAIERSDPKVVAKIVRVLIAEDNPMIFDTIRSGLARLAHRQERVPAIFDCHLALDGVSARCLIENEPIDLLIVDVNLPVLDGDTLIRLCKDLLGPQFPVIAVSGGGKETLERARRAGADVYLNKPLRLAQVYSAMLNLLGLSDDPR